MIRNSLICKLINVQASMKENNEKKINNEHEISKLIKAFPKDIAALDKRSVLAKVNSQGSGRQKPSPGQIPKVEDEEVCRFQIDDPDDNKNYNSKREDLEEEDQRQDERNVIL